MLELSNVTFENYEDGRFGTFTDAQDHSLKLPLLAHDPKAHYLLNWEFANLSPLEIFFFQISTVDDHTFNLYHYQHTSPRAHVLCNGEILKCIAYLRKSCALRFTYICVCIYICEPGNAGFLKISWQTYSTLFCINLHFQITPQDKASAQIKKIYASAKMHRDTDWGISQLGRTYSTDSNAIYIYIYVHRKKIH